ncbi:MAG TPA: ABC transporter ATP-binding protein [Cerasibacillus sp.]|uniref:ABC transporter ATP-binding protein n=1 Tax=Cerasibacillus sp. TaxID=2498711 RepID=UPI002F3FD1EF
MGISIDVKNISKRFGKKDVLQDIDLEVADGEIYGLIGPSGSGKTTLVKMIVGMDRPSAGSVRLLDKKVPDLTVLENIGYMAQADALYTDLTGRENLQFFSSLFSLNKAQQKERITYVSDLVNLTTDLQKKVSTYSGGMKRRLSLAIALIQDPQVIILDEPTVGIDPELRQTIWKELMRLKHSGKTILLTTHIMDEAEKCDRLSMIRDGKIITSGSPKSLKSQYDTTNLEDVFLFAGRESQ